MHFSSVGFSHGRVSKTTLGKVIDWAACDCTRAQNCKRAPCVGHQAMSVDSMSSGRARTAFSQSESAKFGLATRFGRPDENDQHCGIHAHLVKGRERKICIFPHQRPESFFLLALEHSKMQVNSADPIFSLENIADPIGSHSFR